MVAPPDLRLARSRGRARSGDSDHGRVVVWAAFALLGVLLVGYLSVLIVRSSEQSAPWLDWWHVGLEFVASGLCIAAGLRRGRLELVALVLGGACLSWTLGDLLSTLEGVTAPFPSL